MCFSPRAAERPHSLSHTRMTKSRSQLLQTAHYKYLCCVWNSWIQRAFTSEWEPRIRAISASHQRPHRVITIPAAYQGDACPHVTQVPGSQAPADLRAAASGISAPIPWEMLVLWRRQTWVCAGASAAPCHCLLWQLEPLRRKGLCQTTRLQAGATEMVLNTPILTPWKAWGHPRQEMQPWKKHCCLIHWHPAFRPVHQSLFVLW